MLSQGDRNKGEVVGEERSHVVWEGQKQRLGGRGGGVEGGTLSWGTDFPYFGIHL